MVNNYKRTVAAVEVIACARAAEGNVKVKLIVSDKVVVKQQFGTERLWALKQLPPLKREIHPTNCCSCNCVIRIRLLALPGLLFTIVKRFM